MLPINLAVQYYWYQVLAIDYSLYSLYFLISFLNSIPQFDTGIVNLLGIDYIE